MTTRQRLALRDTAERHERVRTAWRVAHALAQLGALLGLGKFCPHHPDEPLIGPMYRCWPCERNRRRAHQDRRDAVRRPPTMLLPLRRGRCRLCASTTLEPRRVAWCSQRCVDLWNMATSREVAYWQLVKLHGHACWECGESWEPTPRDTWSDLVGPPAPRPVKLALDHVRPLWSLTDDERRELRWWLPFNLQLLCTACHKAKTSREAAERAALRRGQLPILLAAAS